MLRFKLAGLVADAKRRNKESLIDGRYMTCPRCRQKHDILRFAPMGQVKEFLAETNPIYKCPSCRWIFSPANHILDEGF